MSSQDTEMASLWSTVVTKYTLCGLSSLTLYRILLNMDQEVDLIWVGVQYQRIIKNLTSSKYQKRGSSKSMKLLYAVVTYGALLEALFVLCLAIISMEQGALNVVVIMGLNGISVAAFVAMMIVMKVEVSESVAPLGHACGYSFPYKLVWVELGSNFAISAYETILLALALCRATWHIRNGYAGSLWSLNTLLAMMTRDHVFYFIVSFLAWGISAASYLPFPFGWGLNLIWTVFSNGPVMLLSIRQFDIAGNTLEISTEEELHTVQFATVNPVHSTATSNKEPLEA
ncbi:hypothetical protein CONPUDRAFT_70731 [Coniophora puteana RWD-64-598 SS2]|uniref:Uncharacterized protein n=1 Tax=Coniophora puteana (strain RWD-64-598) TaxID=741705 RepID=A0A5M3MYC9_CONPW|nr:uncharacterized protein CONPUDRAFT_70731 [Coniophora puteana RWD-64-598 SS2]EIW83784.1 hypothetical protein CONPUDRAFT_70731 [Coniophora puteana RWD-64-598 SS2]